MTRQETIEWFKLMEEKFENTKYADALNMAIEALENSQNCVKCKYYYETEDDKGIHSHCKKGE